MGTSTVKGLRLKLPADSRVFELDFEEVLTYKNSLLSASKTPPLSRATRYCVSADLCTPEWPGLLKDAGFNPSEASLWIVEGLFPYLKESDVNNILSNMCQLSASGSQVLSMFMPVSMTDNTSPNSSISKYLQQQLGTCITSVTDEAEVIMESIGFQRAKRTSYIGLFSLAYITNVLSDMNYNCLRNKDLEGRMASRAYFVTAVKE
jgi:methyltransferase (TIGR00027 family)